MGADSRLWRVIVAYLDGRRTRPADDPDLWANVPPRSMEASRRRRAAKAAKRSGEGT